MQFFIDISPKLFRVCHQLLLDRQENLNDFRDDRWP